MAIERWSWSKLEMFEPASVARLSSQRIGIEERLEKTQIGTIMIH
jgi:hypothetical protein